MIIDAHQHFWKYNAQRDKWITEDMEVLKSDFLPETLLPELRANQVDACIAVQADQSEQETTFLLGQADRSPEVAGGVGWVDLRAPDVSERLQHFSQFPKLRGFRHIVQSEADDRFLLREDFLRGVRALAKFDFSYDILIYARQLPAAMEFASQFPEQRFVLDHIAKPPIRVGGLAEWAEKFRQLARAPNVFCKLSGLVTEADWRNWSKKDFEPYLDVALNAFGPSRLMFGSDWPVCLLAASYQEVKDIIADYTGNLSQDERKQIFGLTAMEFYRLKVANHESGIAR